MKFNMKWTYILAILLITASVLGCIGQKKEDSGATPPPPTPAQSTNDVFGTETEANQLDSMLNDTTLDISLSDVAI